MTREMVDHIARHLFDILQYLTIEEEREIMAQVGEWMWLKRERDARVREE